jgi:dipeptidyl aminopeptidase/acylaminoacyl peptidase
MKKQILLLASAMISLSALAQDVMTPELLWKLGRVSAEEVTADGKNVIYSVSIPNVDANKSAKKTFSMDITYGVVKPFEANETKLDGLPEGIDNKRISADGKYILFTKDVKVEKIAGSDFYSDLPKSNVKIYDQLNYRHWDEYEDGNYSHVFVGKIENGKVVDVKDIMPGKAFDCPQKPHGGSEDVIFATDSKSIVYVTKQKTGTAYATSTNTDILQYDIATGATKNLSENMIGYDMAPQFSKDGKYIAWLSMNRDGFEADKNDIHVLELGTTNSTNITQGWDESVTGFKFSNESANKIFFTGYVNGTEQLLQATFAMPAPNIRIRKPEIKQITEGQFDINALVGQAANSMIVSRSDMNHASEIYSVDLVNGNMKQLTHVNDNIYNSIQLSKVESKWYTTTDGKKLQTWVIYPPNFDASKKYPTLLYCQGGPQSALSQFYSFRWNFQLMAAQGYIVVAPNRRGMPGHGTKWNEQISGDWGGQSIQDYLTAIDSVSKESYVDVNRRGAVGASYGGYSVFMLAGVHNNRFKSFIAHDGVYDTKSWYGTTEEMWFAKWDMGGAPWELNPTSYTKFNPSEYINKWTTPILIYQGGKDYRTPEGQAQQAFNAAQLHNIKSRLVYLPEENHWVMAAQNALVWQREFYKWLNETLK